jgi:hypothetical protein
MKKRIPMLLMVGAMMVVMLAMSVAPAFAAPESPCPGNNGNIVTSLTSPYYDDAYDKNQNNFICEFDRYRDGNLVSVRLKDDRQFL